MYKVMLVEDDEAIRYVYSKMKAWGKYGFCIVNEAENGKCAVEQIKSQDIDVIFTDIRMPQMDGITMMKEIRKDYPDVQFVFISSYNEFEYAREGLRLGAFDYIVKPVSEKELGPVLERMKELLDQQAQNKGNSSVLRLLEGVIPDKEALKDPLILKTAMYMEENINRNLSIDEIADVFNMNKDYLGKQIKNKTSLTFRNFYNGFKIEYAKPMIKSSQYKIYEISELLGYSSPDYFTQLFKSITGMTPAEYKKQI